MGEEKYVFWLDEIGKEHNDLVEKKCANLGEIRKLKLPAPDGFAISIRAFEKFLEETGVRKEIREIPNKTKDLRKGETLSEVSTKIRRLIEEIEIPSWLLSTIEFYYEQLCEK